MRPKKFRPHSHHFGLFGQLTDYSGSRLFSGKAPPPVARRLSPAACRLPPAACVTRPVARYPLYFQAPPNGGSMEQERKGEAFEADVKLTVIGERLKPGDRAPEFSLDILNPGDAFPHEVTLAD